MLSLLRNDNYYMKDAAGNKLPYLDAVKVSFFNDIANIDLVYTPRFDSDRFIDGRRISFYNPAAGGITGEDAIVETDKPDEWFTDDEIAAFLPDELKKRNDSNA